MVLSLTIIFLYIILHEWYTDFLPECGQVKNTALITYAFDKTFPTDEFIFSALTNIYIVFKG